MRALRQNILKLYALDFLQGSMIFIPVLVPFMRSTGLNLQEIFLLQGIFTLSAVVFEIPSGYASDRWGRKVTCIIASITSFIGILLYGISTNFLTFFIGDIFIGIGMSFYSGTLEALTYDTLLELDDVRSYKRITGNLALMQFGSEALVSLAAGYIAVYSLRLPVLLTLIPFGLAFIVTLLLTEPRRHVLQEERHIAAMWRITKESIVHNVPLRGIILLHSVIACMTMSLFWFTQPYQTHIALPLVYFGITHAVIVMMGAIASKYTYSLEKVCDDRLLLTSIAIAVSVAYAGLGYYSSIWALAFFGIARIAWGTLSPLTSTIINRMTTSDIRATVLSIRSFFFRGLFTLASPFLGYMADVLTINQAILITGCIGSVLMLILFVSMRMVWNQIPK